MQVISKHIGNGTTTTDVLEDAGRDMFGKEFLGVFPSDMMPKSLREGQMFIANLDDSKGPGSHWIAVGRRSGKVIVYDSFGRDVLPSPLKKLYGEVLRSEPDAEQSLTEENCGSRSLAWLYILKTFGKDAALKL